MALARELGDRESVLAGYSAFALLRQVQGQLDAAQEHVRSVLQLAKRGDLSEAANQLAHAVELAR